MINAETWMTAEEAKEAANRLGYPVLVRPSYVLGGQGMQIAISDQATLTSGGTTINLFQRNMFAVRAEIEFGFRIASPNYFVRLTDAAA